MFLLDTNVCIQLLNGRARSLADRFRSQSPSSIGLSIIVKAELLHGARKSRRVEDNLLVLHRFFEPFPTLPFDEQSADHFGQIRAQLEAAGTPIGSYDLMIAATARAHDCVLVTHNVREFRRVAGLRVEDWEPVAP